MTSTPDFILTEGTHRDGTTRWVARHAASGQEIDASAVREEMADRVEQLNAGLPYHTWTKKWRPAEHRAQIAADPSTSCHFCGLDRRTCDCR